MKVAYFTTYPVKVSESFFASLIKGLEGKLPEGSFIHIVGTGNASKLAKNTVFSDFILTNGLLRLLFEVQERLLHKKNWALKVMQNHASRKLAKVNDLRNSDVALVEYGNTAVRVYKFLVSRGIPFVVHFHGKDASAAFNSRIYHQEINKVFVEAAYIITASHHIRRLLTLRGCNPDKIKVIRLGIDTEKMQPLSWVTRKLGPPSIVFLGRLTEKKNPIALLHAFKLIKEQIPEAKLTLIGDGNLRDQVKKRIGDLGLSGSVDMLGALAQHEALETMNKHWVFAQHNVTGVDGDQEGYALAPAEAAALELPVVTTLHNGIPEHVVDGETGYLVQEYDYETMASRITELLEDLDLAEQFGRNGRMNISRINNPQSRIDNIYLLLQSACQDALQ